MPFYLALIIALALIIYPSQSSETPQKLEPPAVDGIWLRPSETLPAEPVIGFKDGIQVALWPTNGPRGILRVYAPYVFPPGERPLINFIAVEPVVGGVRCYSELERSTLDKRNGLRMWFSDTLEAPPIARHSWDTPRGVKGAIWQDGRRIDTLRIFLNVEKFLNEAHVAVEILFREDRPYEVGFRVHALEASAEMEMCVLTATMGNYARARHLMQRDEVVDSKDLWPGYQGGDFVHTDHFWADRLIELPDGSLFVAITPDETDLASVKVSPDWWMFKGKVATQYWRKYPGTARQDIRVNVNGRARYYGTNTLIPGGVSYENFELIETFAPAIESWFGVTLGSLDDIR